MADSPVAAESAQALFCAIADFLGLDESKKVLSLEKYPTYALFKASNDKLIVDAYAHLKTTGVKLTQIESILIDDNDWYKSSVNIALKIIEEITKIDKDFAKITRPGWQDILYYRGAKGGSEVMENIEELFKVANKQDKLFGDVNKWSPADIYFASKNAENKIKSLKTNIPKGFNFTNLNQQINKLIDTGDLLGVSLKKAPDSVHIYRINFTTTENEKLLENIKYLDISDDKGVSARDISIYFGSSKAKPLIKIRHDPYSDALGINLSIKCEIEGKNARLGSLTSFGNANSNGTGITDLWSRVDPEFARKLYSSFMQGSADYKKAIPDLNKQYAILVGTKKTGIQLKEELKKVIAPESLIKKILKLNGGFDFEKKLGMTNLQSIMNLKPTLYQAYQNERIYLSVTYIVSSFRELIRGYFTEGKRVQDVTEKNATKSDISLQIKKNNVILEFYKYASSMSPSSGRFVVAK